MPTNTENVPTSRYLPTDVPTPNWGEDIGDVPKLDAVVTKDGWRVEVQHNGSHFQWRRGRGKERQYHWGGKFNTLSPERQAAYVTNKARRHKAK